MNAANQVIQNTSAQSKYPCLYQFSQKELDELFETLPLVDAAEFTGYYRGRFFAVLGLGILPRGIRRGLYRLLETFINPWRGKQFEAGNGGNVWLHSTKGARFGFYNVELDDDGYVTQLNYNVSCNAAWLQPVRGDVRMLSENRYLARMNYETANRVYRVLYFTLIPASMK